MNVMIVDDEPFSIKLLSRQLEAMGINDVLGFVSARQALNLLQDQPGAVELVFCDLQMPEMDGVELVRNMGRLGCTQGVVLISGEDVRTLQSVERVALAYEVSVYGMLQKPVSMEQLESLFQGMQTKQRQASEPHSRKQYDARELHDAIVQDQLVNVYQPKVSLADGQLSGAEALVRWQHPLDGMVFPDQFIETAEQNGLMHSLTRCVLISVLKDIHLWADSNIQLQVAINVSMENLADQAFPEQITDLLASHGVPVSRIGIELTESRLSNDERLPLEILTRLRLKGFRLSLDDFGTGHSSLSHLRNLPFDELKIDRSFVNGVSSDEVLAVIVRSNVEMARNLGLSTVAEGVETSQDWRFLRDCGVDQAQGYLIAKPMLACHLPEWCADWQAGLPEFLNPQND